MKEKSFYKKWWFYLIVVLVVFGVGGAVGSAGSKASAKVIDNQQPSLTESSDTLYTIGKEVTGKTKMAMTIEKIDETTDTGNDFLELKDGKKLVVFDVILKNNSDKELPYNPMYFKAKSTDGNEGQFSVTAIDGLLQSDALSPGDFVKGKVVFEFPKDAKIKTLTLNDAIFSKDIELKFAA